ncbi:hypothetical protein BDW22DRAFT_1350540 [Trametopsis cervina]|nr:hypothetical protein BDW22DRAFT_1350540 [Trametopsis cervina]
MFIAVIGTRSAGKSTLQEYLIQNKDFTSLRLAPLADADESFYEDDSRDTSEDEHMPQTLSVSSSRPMSFLMMNSPVMGTFPRPPFVPHSTPANRFDREMVFQSETEMLNFVTQNWRSNFVTTELNTYMSLETFRTRPFFMVVSVDAPILTRYRRTLRRTTHSELTLERFVADHDDYLYGGQFGTTSKGVSSLRNLQSLIDIQVNNSFDTVEGLHEHLGELDITNAERLRPGWDTYFMRLADLASLRSNCMKRRVGAILVRNKRILATGYNGTPRGLTNCNEGGCTRCNSASETPDECVCLHAEENALLEAGRERIGDGASLYCNTCPCLKCTIKIIQTGVKEVVYNLSYKVDDASSALFHEAGVVLRRYAAPPMQ